MIAFLCTIFFASGFSALVFETLWFRQAGLAFGNSVWASSLVLSGFMGGLALGNAVAARHGDRLGNPLRAFAVAETAIAATGIGLVYLFPVLGAALAAWFRPLLDHSGILNFLRLLTAFLLLLIPSTAMGVTLPLLTQALRSYDPHFGSVLGRLYGWNTLGAVSGAVIGESYLIGALGLHGAALTAGALNLAAAAVSAGLSKRKPSGNPAPARGDRPALSWASGGRWLAAAFLSGFCLLALEVIWFRFLLLFVEGHSLAFALMLGVVLSGIGLGGLAASSWLRRSADAHRFGSAIAFAGGALCVLSYAAFPLVIAPFATSPDLILNHAPEILRVGALLMFPVSFLSGVFFTVVGAALRNTLASEIETTGALTLANTAGAAVGSLIGAFLLLPVLGMEKSFFLISVLYGGIGALLLSGRPGSRKPVYATAALFLLAIMLFPFGSMDHRLIQIRVKGWLQKDAPAGLAAVHEGINETIIYIERRMLGRPISYRLVTNSHSMSSTGYGARRYMKLYVYWPMAVHPNLKRVLLIAYGVGNTAKAMADSKSLETIDIVDLSPDILEMNRIVYPANGENPLNDPRVRVHVEDGRYFVQTTDQRFDLITSEPPPPQNAGVVNLYTREYFRLLYERLAEGGIVTYWLPLEDLSDESAKAVLSAFCDVFEDCSLWNGMGKNLMMVGTRNARGPVSEERFIRQWNDPVVAAEMKRLGFEQPEQLGALFIGDAEYLKGLTADAQPLVDDQPKRIEAPPGPEEDRGLFFARLTGAAPAKERFRRSPLIKRLWPERLLIRSLPFFEFQDIIKTHFFGDTVLRPLGIEDAHRLLTRSSLSTLPFWRLGGDSDVQQAITRLDPEDLPQPLVQFFLGIRLISERNYAKALEPLRRAEPLANLRDYLFAVRIYALCKSGRTGQARQFVKDRFAPFLSRKGMSHASLEPFWLWMKETFGIDPLVGT